MWSQALELPWGELIKQPVSGELHVASFTWRVSAIALRLQSTCASGKASHDAVLGQFNAFGPTASPPPCVISACFYLHSFAARACRRLPSSLLAVMFPVSSPVAIRITLMAAPITSTGLLSPLGPLGMRTS